MQADDVIGMPADAEGEPGILGVAADILVPWEELGVDSVHELQVRPQSLLEMRFGVDPRAEEDGDESREFRTRLLQFVREFVEIVTNRACGESRAELGIDAEAVQT